MNVGDRRELVENAGWSEKKVLTNTSVLQSLILNVQRTLTRTSWPERHGLTAP